MNVQEIETAIRYKTPIVVLIWNDNGYGLIEWKQMTQFGRASHVLRWLVMATSLCKRIDQFVPRIPWKSCANETDRGRVMGADL